MNIAITFRHMTATDAVKAYASEKVGKLQKFLRQPMKAAVVLSCENHRFHNAEVDVHCDGEQFHATETSDDMYASIDKVIDKLERQITERTAAAAARRKGAERAADHLGRTRDEE